jgi:ribosomal protein L11 methyltransferase
MRTAFNIAPRVLVYPRGTPPPPVEEGWLALAQFVSWPPAALDSPPRCAVFGDGSHPTTRLCAAAVDLLCRQRSGLAVLDVGTGTGILARIARARGASFVVGTDIDAAAVACAKAHAGLDEVGSTGGPAAGGGAAIGGGASLANIYFGAAEPDDWGARFDLVVANILEAPLHVMAPALCRALLPGGVLLICGFTRPQAPALRLTYQTAGLQSVDDFTLDDWVLLKFARAVRS